MSEWHKTAQAPMNMRIEDNPSSISECENKFKTKINPTTTKQFNYWHHVKKSSNQHYHIAA